MSCMPGFDMPPISTSIPKIMDTRAQKIGNATKNVLAAPMMGETSACEGVGRRSPRWCLWEVDRRGKARTEAVPEGKGNPRETNFAVRTWLTGKANLFWTILPPDSQSQTLQFPLPCRSPGPGGGDDHTGPFSSFAQMTRRYETLRLDGELYHRAQGGSCLRADRPPRRMAKGQVYVHAYVAGQMVAHGRFVRPAAARHLAVRRIRNTLSIGTHVRHPVYT